MIKLVIFLTLILSTSLSIIYSNGEAISFESQESKISDNGNVYNSIKWFDLGRKDIWMMNQSHSGPNAKGEKLDRLAIVIDKTKSPKVASFFQLEPGPLKWSNDIKVKPFKVSCFVCHSNGLRAIRPNMNSKDKPIGLAQSLKLKMWNIKIKSYGVVVASEKDLNSYRTQFPPFKWQQPQLNKKLNIKTCNYCHKNNGILARGVLTKQNAPTIKFLYESGQMPPFGMKLSKNEKHELEKFIGNKGTF